MKKRFEDLCHATRRNTIKGMLSKQEGGVIASSVDKYIDNYYKARKLLIEHGIFENDLITLDGFIENHLSRKAVMKINKHKDLIGYFQAEYFEKIANLSEEYFEEIYKKPMVKLRSSCFYL